MKANPFSRSKAFKALDAAHLIIKAESEAIKYCLAVDLTEYWDGARIIAAGCYSWTKTSRAVIRAKRIAELEYKNRGPWFYLCSATEAGMVATDYRYLIANELDFLERDGPRDLLNALERATERVVSP